MLTMFICLQRLGDPIAAIQSIRSSLIVTPNMTYSRLLQEALHADVKREAVVARRDYEINIRRMTMVCLDAWIVAGWHVGGR
jgi:hypothetical protein